MNAQPKALKLANEVDRPFIEANDWEKEAAAELRRLHAENEALRASIKRANEQAEHFEREWYLCCDKNEDLQKDAERFRFANDSEEDFAICYWDETMGNGGEWMCNGSKGYSIDLLDVEIAKAKSDARCPLCRYEHGHAIGCKNNPVDKAIAAINKATGEQA